ncbi:MAG: esterase-like activity of phytase family protein, partial [Alphaproteobacteria bacterium]|nr:esterase-like activity of phytase family protein [Alphaproteobacteria bacterium]
IPVNDVQVSAITTNLIINGRAAQHNEVFGNLQFLDVANLKGDNPDFGGFSALALDSGQLVALTDKAKALRLSLNPNEPLVGQFPQKARFVNLGDQNKTALKGENKDSEAMVLRSNSEAFVAFEQRHRIARHDLNTGQLLSDGGSALLIPENVLKSVPVNGGFEAFTRLNDGRFLGITEEGYANKDKSEVYGVLWATNGKPTVLRYQRSGTFRVTDAVALDNGDILVLERDFDILTMRGAGRIVRFRSTNLNADVIKPELLLGFGFDAGIDNLEGLAARKNQDGSYTLVIISDDNFNTFQETVLSRWVYRP